MLRRNASPGVDCRRACCVPRTRSRAYSTAHRPHTRPRIFFDNEASAASTHHDIRPSNQERNGGRWHRGPPLSRRYRHQRRPDRRGGQGGGFLSPHHRCGGFDRRPWVRRSTHALRRPDLLGRCNVTLQLARGDIGGDGQLRRRARAVPTGGARYRRLGPRQCRSDPDRGAREGCHLGLGNIPGIHGRRRATRLRSQSRFPGGAHPLPSLRARRRIHGARRDHRRNCRDQCAIARRHGRRRDGLHDHQCGAAHRLPRSPIGLSLGEPRRTHQLLARTTRCRPRRYRACLDQRSIGR